VRAVRTEVGTGESDDHEVADKVSLSASIWKPCFARMVIT
jgi:hypothetical protein